MAKFQSTLIEQASGKLGDNIVMRQTATGKILCKAPKKASTPRRSSADGEPAGKLSSV